MAALQQPRAGDQASTHNWGFARVETKTILASDVAVGSAEKPRLAGSIAIGAVIGAVAAILVGGLVGIHETSSGAANVSTASISQPAAP